MSTDPSPADKLRTAFELYEAAREIQHQNLRRRHPAESEEQIHERLRRWLLKEDEPLEGPWILRRPQAT